MSKITKTIKKTMRRQIESRLEASFGDLQQALGKTKFRRNIKRASKVLIADLKKNKGLAEEPLLLPEAASVASQKKRAGKKA
jgi:hypothetical protein